MINLKPLSMLVITAIIGAGTMTYVTKANSQEVSLKLHTFVPAVAASFKNLKWWAEKVTKASGNRIQIKIFTGFELRKSLLQPGLISSIL